MSAQPKRVEFFCETCGSTDIGIDACAHWDIPSQKWEFTSTYDQTWCSTCGSEMIGEREASPHVWKDQPDPLHPATRGLDEGAAEFSAAKDGDYI